MAPKPNDNYDIQNITPYDTPLFSKWCVIPNLSNFRWKATQDMMLF